MAQLLPAARDAPQLLDWLKSELLTPKIVMLAIANDAPPVFVKAKLFAALAVPVT